MENPFAGVFLPRLIPDYMRYQGSPFGLDECGASPIGLGKSFWFSFICISKEKKTCFVFLDILFC